MENYKLAQTSALNANKFKGLMYTRKTSNIASAFTLAASMLN